MASSLLMQRQKKGQTPTLLSAAEANRLIDFYNAWRQAEVRPAGAGTVTIGEQNVIIDLSQSIGDLQARMTALEQQNNVYLSLITTITAALANATIVCNPDGTISLTFPGIAKQPLI